MSDGRRATGGLGHEIEHLIVIVAYRGVSARSLYDRAVGSRMIANTHTSSRAIVCHLFEPVGCRKRQQVFCQIARQTWPAL
jgi:hypothetical protein